MSVLFVCICCWCYFESRLINKLRGGNIMVDLKGCFKDMKDKVVGKGKEVYGKVIDDKSKEIEGKV